jgi:hypothetical protein
VSTARELTTGEFRTGVHTTGEYTAGELTTGELTIQYRGTHNWRADYTGELTIAHS